MWNRRLRDFTDYYGFISRACRPYHAHTNDGSRMAFVSDRDGNFEIYVMGADGSGQARLTDNPADDIEPAWFQ